MKRNEKQGSLKSSACAAIGAALLAAVLAGCSTFPDSDGGNIATVEMPIDHGTGGNA
jgi:hypothetical protein